MSLNITSILQSKTRMSSQPDSLSWNPLLESPDETKGEASEWLSCEETGLHHERGNMFKD